MESIFRRASNMLMPKRNSAGNVACANSAADSPTGTPRTSRSYHSPPMRYNRLLAVPEAPSTAMLRLEEACKRKEFYLLLLFLLPTQDAENKLRLLSALLDFKTFISLGSNGGGEVIAVQARARKIATMFFQNGSKYEVANLPSHLLKDNMLHETCDLVKHMVLCDLVALPEVQAALQSDEAANREGEEEEEEPSKEEGSSPTLLPLKPLGLQQQYGDLKVIGQLEAVIGNSAKRRDFIHLLLSQASEFNLGVKVRFVSAVNQVLACEDEVEQRKLASKVFLVFAQPGGMFELAGLSPALRRAMEKSIDGLDMARLEILKELSLNAQVVKICNQL